MARLPRTIVFICPHYILQRGNRRVQISFEDGYYERYRSLLGHIARKADVRLEAKK